MNWLAPCFFYAAFQSFCAPFPPLPHAPRWAHMRAQSQEHNRPLPTWKKDLAPPPVASAFLRSRLLFLYLLWDTRKGSCFTTLDRQMGGNAPIPARAFRAEIAIRFAGKFRASDASQ
ncbi:hypothetical protein BC940DRAFT_308393 [Gongronella butleri]|nr:hypothetical protein BC940DRAFT_308393 [Gongronella butleri]